MRAGARAAAFAAAAALTLGMVLAPGATQGAPDAPRASTRVPLPVIEAAAGDRCVEDTPTMRRNHMELLQHHRDRTVREGIRTTKHSLANCVNCHADPKTGRVTGSKDAFCEGCHSYGAVKLDCFECHADRARAPTATGSAR